MTKLTNEQSEYVNLRIISGHFSQNFDQYVLFSDYVQYLLVQPRPYSQYNIRTLIESQADKVCH